MTTNNETKELFFKGGIQNQINTNSPAVFANGGIYFVSANKTMKYALQNGAIGATN